MTCACGHDSHDHDWWGWGECLQCACPKFRHPTVEAARREVNGCVTKAGRFDAVHEMAREGRITREQARSLLEIPEIDVVERN